MVNFWRKKAHEYKQELAWYHDEFGTREELDSLDEIDKANEPDNDLPF